MNLKELQAMIKEELDTYMNEEEVDVDVDMDAGDIDADGAEEGNTDEDILMQIYNMLKDKFEGEDDAEEVEDEEAEEEDAELAEATEEIEEAKDEDLDEGSQDSGPFRGKVAGKPKKIKTKVDTYAGNAAKEGASAEATHLQERFQKLANIIK